MTDGLNKANHLKAIEHGKGIQHILNRAYKITGNPMLVFDMEYKLLAFSGFLVGDDPVWAEFIRNGELGEKTVALLGELGFIEDVANSTKRNGVTYLINRQLKYNRIFGQIYNKSLVPVAGLISVKCEAPFPKEMPEHIRMICDILSEELCSSTECEDYGQIYQENILKELVEGKIEDKTIYVGHVANLDRFFNGYIFMAVVDISCSTRKNASLIYYKNKLKNKMPGFCYFIYNHHILILFTAETKRINGENTFQSMHKLFQRNNLYAGISSGFENLFELQKYYQQALAVLTDGLKRKSTRQIFCYDNMD